MRIIATLLLLAALYLLVTTKIVEAVYDPLSVPNNKFGIHIIHATPDESSPAASLANTNGDWGYVTFLIESKDRDHNKWQAFFNELRSKHLIPIVRLATKPLNDPSADGWERPYEGEEKAWADFLNSLNWPTKNRYVIVYNEPNHGKEWGNFVDAKMYAKVLDKVITELKSKNRDYFVLNGGFDASAPSKPPLYEDQVKFMRQMEEEVPGIFNKLDGWVSHSYPNPNFTGSPDDNGRGTIRTWYWELQILREMGVTKNLPVFITETGWQHAEGLQTYSSFPSAEKVAQYYKSAFEIAWSSQRIVAITPFLLDYQEGPFDHFSFKKFNGNGTQNTFYPQYHTIKNLPKVAGKPVQEHRAQLIKGEIYNTIVSGESYQINLTLKNIGQSIWNDSETVKLIPLKGGNDLGIKEVEVPPDTKIEPGQEYTFQLDLHAPGKGSFNLVLNLFFGSEQFESGSVEFTTEVKSPVILKIISLLKWKRVHKGEYLLSVKGPTGETVQKIILSEAGQSGDLEARYLLPGYTFEFSLEKENYKVKTIQKELISGENILDFGTLEPNILSAILNPIELWDLLPFSN
ncbi:MAG: hypothetical protein Q8P92_00295 [Candidatus Daviesbacteria bacterium]|nr:hypothetical protein [Candidatus Daviesbacteria bacterium]